VNFTGGIGESGGLAAAAGDEAVSAERVIVIGLGIVRTGTLLLGAIQLLAGAKGPNSGLAALAFAIVGTTSVAVFVRAAMRLRHLPAVPAFDSTAALAETLAGLCGLLLLRGATPAYDLLSPGFWMLPYTVVTAVMLAAGFKRVISGLADSLVLTAGYLTAVSPALHAGSNTVRGAGAAALNNALSYSSFFAFGLIIFHLYRFVTNEVGLLRRLAADSSAERARLIAARGAYRLGHDYPKAYLREFRRAERPTADLRLWATRFRSDLLTALSADPRTTVDLAEEMENVVATFAGAMSVTLDTRALIDELKGVPVLVVVEAVRECLNNASYHCYGSTVTATATSANGDLVVTVHDDGPGCNPDQVMAAWALKQNAVYLVEAAGGRFTVESGPATGTTVRLSYPLSGQDRRSP
jgi:signal transduction histidine kinase